MNTNRTTLPIIELVTGRLAVVVLATCLAPSGVLQLTTSSASDLLNRAGGRALDVTWSLSLILAWLFLVAGFLISRRGDDEAATMLERIGSLCLVAGVGVYAVVVIQSTGWLGGTMALGFCASCIVNVSGRHLLVWWRGRRLVRTAHKILDQEGGGGAS